jgi:hypothetical protein
MTTIIEDNLFCVWHQLTNVIGTFKTKELKIDRQFFSNENCGDTILDLGDPIEPMLGR